MNVSLIQKYQYSPIFSKIWELKGLADWKGQEGFFLNKKSHDFFPWEVGSASCSLLEGVAGHVGCQHHVYCKEGGASNQCWQRWAFLILLLFSTVMVSWQSYSPSIRLDKVKGGINDNLNVACIDCIFCGGNFQTLHQIPSHNFFVKSVLNKS